MTRFAPLILLAMTVSVVFFTFTGHRGVTVLLRVNEQVTMFENEINALEAEIERMETKIDAAKNSSFFLEKKAREELALSRAGDIVYILPKNLAQKSTKGYETPSGSIIRPSTTPET